MSKCSTFNNFIKRADIYGYPITFNYKGEETLKSVLGGYTSILYQISVFIIFLINIIAFFTDNQPIITANKLYRDHNRPEVVPTNFFNISIGLASLKEGKIEYLQLPIIYQTILSVETNIKTNTYTQAQVGSVLTCDKYYKQLNVISDISSIIDNFLCTNFTKPTIYAGIDIIKSYYNSLQAAIVIDTCSMFNNDQCTDNDHPLLLSILFGNNYTNLLDPQGYSPSFDYKEYMNFNANLDYKILITYTKNTLITDNNFIYSFFKPEKVVYFSMNLDIQPTERPKKNPYLMITQHYIYDDYENIIYRSYTKFDETLANIFSIIEIFAVLGSVICYVFTNGNLERKIANDLYFFEPDDNNRGSSSIRLMRSVKSINNNDNSANVSNNVNQFSSRQLNTIDKEKYISGDRIKKENCLFFYRYICVARGNKQSNIKKHLTAENLLTADMDIRVILMKLIEYENIKKIIFNKQQVECIKMIRNRNINFKIKEDESCDKIYNDLFIDIKELDGISSYFKLMRASNEEYDKRIIDYLPEEF